MGEILLQAEAKLVELLKQIKPNIESSGRGRIKRKPHLPEGITHKQSHYAQTLADHHDVIDEVIQEARENKVNQL